MSEQGVRIADESRPESGLGEEGFNRAYAAGATLLLDAAVG